MSVLGYYHFIFCHFLFLARFHQLIISDILDRQEFPLTGIAD